MAKNQELVEKIKLILTELFYVQTAGLLFFVLIELWRPRLVFVVFNLNLWLIFWLINGIVLVIWPRQNK